MTIERRDLLNLASLSLCLVIVAAGLLSLESSPLLFLSRPLLARLTLFSSLYSPFAFRPGSKEKVTMASLRTTSRILASSRPLFRPATFARSYATVESAQVRTRSYRLLN